MKKLILLLCIVACAPQKPALYGSNHTDNYARSILPTKDFLIEPQWPEMLKRQPIIIGKRKLTYSDLVAAQARCNQFNWAHKDEKLSTPKEAQAKGWGDCKDAAICKYYWLRSLGGGPEQINIWQGWYGKKYEGHLTLAVRIGADQWVLDDTLALPARAEKYMHKVFEPYARFNEVGYDVN